MEDLLAQGLCLTYAPITFAGSGGRLRRDKPNTVSFFPFGVQHRLERLQEVWRRLFALSPPGATLAAG
jgi:hypothetical protein